MLKQLLVLITTSLFFNTGYSQQPEQILNRWSEKSPVEKVYLHFDRNDYMAGQTVWFKGYLYSDFLPSIKSTTLFVEVLNTASSVINRQVLPIFGGFARGQIELPDTLSGGSYILRAYTATMLNHDPDFLYKKRFYVFGKNKKEAPVVAADTKTVRMEFFPEGGNFIGGLSNSIAFKATSENGLPVQISGVIKNEKGEKVAEFSSYHDGMGFFDLTAEEKNNYYAVLNDDQAGQKYALPLVTTKGIVLRIISIAGAKQFEILQRHDDPVFKAAYMIGQMQHHVVFKTALKEGKDEMTGMIETAKLSSGILHITVFNKEGLPLAERLTFVDNKEYIQPGDISVDTLDFADRGRNHFTLSLKDTIKGSFSVSVYDPAFDTRSKREENIFSGLLLTSDLKGYIHDPAWYFVAGNDSMQNAIDLVMMTNGWRRFRWSDMVKDPPPNKYADAGYITLAGKINLEGTKKPFADKELLTFIVTADSSRNMQMLHTNAEGHFRLDSMIFFNNVRILFSDIKGRKSKFIDVTLDGDSLHRYYPIPGLNKGEQLFARGQTTKIPDDYSAIMKAEGVMLEGVTVKGVKKTKLQQLEDEYVSGAFSGDANRTVDLSEEDLTPYRNILDYLQFRVAGLQIQLLPDGTGYSVTYRQQVSASEMGNIAMAIYLNEVPTDADVLSTIPANDVVLVKVFGSLAAAAGNAPGGVLAIYTKKGIDLSAYPLAGETITYRGYSVIKEFYSPDYRVTKTKKPDQRITLYWNPSVLVADADAKIPVIFYNNDRTRQFKIVIEGLTMEGKMLMIEKTISGKKAF